MRELVAKYLSNGLSRRDFVRRLVGSGVSLASAHSIVESVSAYAQPGAGAAGAPDDIRIFQGTAGAAFA